MKTTNNSIIIIGSGIAGLYAALKLAESDSVDRDVLIVTKSTLGESNSRYAQGGIVGVLPENNNDSVELHVKDTLKAGAGLTDFDVARFVSQNSAEAIKDLIEYGVPFDRNSDEKIALTLEAAHSVRRILHAGGDATGKSIELTLVNLVEKNPKIKIYQKTQAVDLLIDSKNVCRGSILYNTETGEYEPAYSPVVIIATGGVGQVYNNTTNPKIATGDGIALAYRSNAIIQDMEFIQFHPTALALKDNDTRFLISESVRGEGARLRNLNGEFFTFKYDTRGDLAPRDIVTRSIFFEMRVTNAPYVYLDTSLIDQDKLKSRFPNIRRVCSENGIDVLKDFIPVSPAAHYTMGGVKTAMDGRTSIAGLFAVGEASCTSLHGANRLASNSLLECVVTSREVAKYLSVQNLESGFCGDEKIADLISKYSDNLSDHDISGDLKSLKDIMWQRAGIIRNEKDLSFALKMVNELKSSFNREFKCNSLDEYEYRNLLIIAELIIKSALARRESRGAHFREDYRDTGLRAYHSYCRKGENALLYSELCNR